MKLTPEDLEKLQTKQLANVIRKLNAGKTLTAREEALLAQSRVGGSPTADSAFASTWDELAQRLGVTRKSLQNWRHREDLGPLVPDPRADGRHDVAAWSRFMVEHGLASSDEDLSDDEFPQGSVTDWKKRREQLMCVKLEREIARDDGKLLVASDLEVPLGATFMAIQTKLAQFPDRVAKRVTGFTDVQEVEARLREEMDGDLRDLHAAEYLDLLDTIAIPFNEETDALYKRVSFDGQDREAFCELAKLLAREVLRQIGSKIIGDCTETKPGESAPDQCKNEPESCKIEPEIHDPTAIIPQVTAKVRKPKRKKRPKSQPKKTRRRKT